MKKFTKIFSLAMMLVISAAGAALATQLDINIL